MSKQLDTLAPPVRPGENRLRRHRRRHPSQRPLGEYRDAESELRGLLEPSAAAGSETAFRDAACTLTAAPLDLAGLALPAAPASPRTAELFYDSIAEEFDAIMNRYDLLRRLETVFDTLLGNYDLTGRTLLDAGCGTGWFSLWAGERGADVTAVDIGPRLLTQVRRKCQARTLLGDVLDLQFDDDSFDVVVSSECIEHTRDPRQAVREIIRVCRPGGLAVVTSPNRTWWWLCALANRLHLRPYEGLENWPRWGELRRWVEEAGSHIIERRGIHLFPFQISLFHPLLRFLDRFGRTLGPLCVNQAVLAVKS